MKTNYVLIDFENVQPKNLAMLNGHDFRVMVFVGANQEQIPFNLVSTGHDLGSYLEYVKISGKGKDALDFHIAYYIGQLSEKNPDAQFYIISRDEGFDPLVQHLNTRNVIVERKKTLAEIPLLRISNASFIDERIEAITKDLASRGQSRPRKLKPLANTINSLFKKSLDESELEAIIEELKEREIIVIDKERVSYNPPIATRQNSKPDQPSKKTKPQTPKPQPNAAIPKSESNGSPDNLPENRGKAWTPEEEQMLLVSFDAQTSIQELAKDHKRGIGGIQHRLIKLGRLAPDEYHPYQLESQ